MRRTAASPACARPAPPRTRSPRLRRGHTLVSHQPPNYGGPRLFLEGDADGDGTFEAMIGDTVPAGTQLRVRVEDAPGTLLRIVSNGERELTKNPVPVTGAPFTYTFKLPA